VLSVEPVRGRWRTIRRLRERAEQVKHQLNVPLRGVPDAVLHLRLCEKHAHTGVPALGEEVRHKSG